MALTENLTASPDRFVRRHIGPRPADAGEMLKQLGYASLDAND